MIVMRQSKMECLDHEKIDQFLQTALTGFLGLSDQNYPYVIPLNYVYYNGDIYFHGASEGRKTEIIHRNPEACFTVSEELGTMTHPVPAKTDTAYMSVMLIGQIEKLNDLETMTAVMQKMLDKYVPGYYDQALSSSHVEKYTSSLNSKTAVYCLKVVSMTAKENPMRMGARFYPGKKVQHDRNGSLS